MSRPTAAPPTRWHRLVSVLAVATALAASSLLVRQASLAATSPASSTGLNAWLSGSVQLADDAPGAALFRAGRLVPGATGERCLQVAYTGDLPADVRLTVPLADGALTPWLRLSVTEGTGGRAGSCSGFRAARVLAEDVPLAELAAHRPDWAGGLAGWAPAGPAVRSYRLSWRLADGAPQAAAARASLVWAARER